MKSYLSLTKFGIVVFVLLSGLVGYLVSYPLGQNMELWQPIFLLLGLYLLSSGSFAINQAQEWRIDAKMPRTQKRPIPKGEIAPWQAYAIGFLFCAAGLFFLNLLSPLTAQLGFATVILYNVVYTLYWKRKWSFGAVPGAIPGAMPVVIGYSVNHVNLITPDCIYLFLIMFLWQMPHFWALAIRFKDDYKRGGVPVLPLALGDSRTLYQIGLYTFVYVGLGLALPLFYKANVLYLLLVVPICIKLLLEFFRYQKSTKDWLPFFLWVNLSLLVFISVPVVDKWVFYFVSL